MKTLSEMPYEKLMYSDIHIDEVLKSGMCSKDEAEELSKMFDNLKKRMREIHKNRFLNCNSLLEAKDLVTIETLNSLSYGESVELNDEYELYHYSDDEIIVLNHEESGEEILQISSYSDEGIEFESLI